VSPWSVKWGGNHESVPAFSPRDNEYQRESTVTSGNSEMRLYQGQWLILQVRRNETIRAWKSLGVKRSRVQIPAARRVIMEPGGGWSHLGPTSRQTGRCV
jgi:hypothetical protein